MKKYAILLGLAVVATVAMGQHQKATLHQYGVKNAAMINQIGNHNEANVYQAWYHNGANVKQNGEHNDAYVLQLGSFNFTGLEQDGNHADATILQFGFKNLTLIKQYSHSEANVTQDGNYNIAAGASIRFSCWMPCYKDWCFNRCNLTLNTEYYRPIELDKHAKFTLTQDGDFNRFFANGMLSGTQTILQKGYGNFIYLKQEGGVSNLRQKGELNMIWLTMGKHADYAKISQYGYANRVALDQQDGKSWIYQRGAFNSIAYYGKGICDNCPTDLAKFEGDDLKVVQIGCDNRLSLKSESHMSDVTVYQWGQSNYGTVIQTSNGNGNGPCQGCGNN